MKNVDAPHIASPRMMARAEPLSPDKPVTHGYRTFVWIDVDIKLLALAALHGTLFGAMLCMLFESDQVNQEVKWWDEA
jgi:hypothetical protein